MATSAEIRQQLVAALRSDLIGPGWDDVLARLLALNAERYDEKMAQGLHSKAGKRAAGPAAPEEAKRRGRPPKTAQGGETGGQHSEQMGLGL